MDKIRKIIHYIKLEKAYLRLGIYTTFSYPLDSVLWTISMLVREAISFIGIILLASVLGEVEKWNINEICILFSMSAIPESLGQCFLDSVWNIGGAYIRTGKFDILLVRPAPVLLQLQGQRFNFQAFITFIIATVIFFSCYQNENTITIGSIIFFMEFVIIGTLINSTIYLIFNSLNFWFVQANDLAKLVQIFRQLSKYPLNIFPTIIKVFLTYIIPFGFVAYYPASFLLKKTTLNVPLLLPSVAGIMTVVAGVIWNKGLNSYESTGT